MIETIHWVLTKCGHLPKPNQLYNALLLCFLYFLRFLFTSVQLTKITPLPQSLKSVNLFLLLFSCVQASDHMSSVVEQLPTVTAITASHTAWWVPSQTEQNAHWWGSALHGSSHLCGKLLCQYIATGSKCLSMPCHYIGHKNSSCQA